MKATASWKTDIFILSIASVLSLIPPYRLVTNWCYSCQAMNRHVWMTSMMTFNKDHLFGVQLTNGSQQLEKRSHTWKFALIIPLICSKKSGRRNTIPSCEGLPLDNSRAQNATFAVKSISYRYHSKQPLKSSCLHGCIFKITLCFFFFYWQICKIFCLLEKKI